MVSSSEFTAGGGPASTSRPVSRDVNLQVGFLGIDSLYLVMEYPHPAVYEMWMDTIGNEIDNPELSTGIPYAGYLLRRGAHGYKLSVWDGDARLYLTNRVNEVLDETPSQGQGMGLMLQLGPKWLREYGDYIEEKRLKANILGQFAAFGVMHAEAFPVRINRMDVTLDLLGLDINSQSIDDWRGQWVGAAKPRRCYFSPRSAAIEGFVVGSSSGNVSFRAYDKVVESQQDSDYQFWCSVWNRDPDDDSPVTRFEWSTRPYQARFAHMRYLDEFTYEGFLKLLNYVTSKWGRLCMPQANDSNQSRWPLSPLWVQLRELLEDETFDFTEVATREYDFTPYIGHDYIEALTGWLAGLMARVALRRNDTEPVSLEEALRFLELAGYPEAFMRKKAEKKLRVMQAKQGATW